MGELSSRVPQDCYCWRDRSWQDPTPGHCTVSKQIDTPSLPGKEAGQPAQRGPQRALGERGWGRHTPDSVEPTWSLQKGRSTHLRGPDFGSCYQTTRLCTRLWSQTRALGFQGTRTSRESSQPAATPSTQQEAAHPEADLSEKQPAVGALGAQGRARAGRRDRLGSAALAVPAPRLTADPGPRTAAPLR